MDTQLEETIHALHKLQDSIREGSKYSDISPEGATRQIIVLLVDALNEVSKRLEALEEEAGI